MHPAVHNYLIKASLSVSAKFQIPVCAVSQCVLLSGNAFTQAVKHRGSAPPQRKAFITPEHPTFTGTVGAFAHVCVCL